MVASTAGVLVRRSEARSRPSRVLAWTLASSPEPAKQSFARTILKKKSDLVQNQESHYLKNPPSEVCGPFFTPILFFLLFGHFSGRLVSPTVANFFFLLSWSSGPPWIGLVHLVFTLSVPCMHFARTLCAPWEHLECTLSTPWVHLECMGAMLVG